MNVNKRIREDDAGSSTDGMQRKFVSVKKSDVPAYLQTSKFYLSLGDDENDILVPADCLKVDDSVDNNEDLRSLLLALQFWDAPVTRKSVFDYTFRQPLASYKTVLSEFYSAFPELNSIKNVLVKPKHKQMHQAMMIKSFEIAKYLHAECGLEWSPEASMQAAQTGNLPWLKIIVEAGIPLDCKVSYTACMFGHLECLKFLREKGCPWNEDPFDLDPDLEKENWDEVLPRDNMCTVAAYHGFVDVLKYVHSQGVPLVREALYSAARYGHLDCMKYIIEQGVVPLSAAISGAAIAAIFTNCLEHVKYLQEVGCPLPKDACLTAVQNNCTLDLIVYLHTQGCGFDEQVCSAAVGQSAEIVAYLIRHGCPISSNLCNWNTEEQFLEVMTAFAEMQLPWTLIPKATRRATERDYFDALKFLVARGCPIHVRCIEHAVCNGRLDVLEYLIEQGCVCNEPEPDREEYIANALARGHLHCVQLVRYHGCEIADTTCEELLNHYNVSNLSVECFAFAHKHGGCMLTPDFTEKAARHGLLDVLTYLHKRGCKWSSNATLGAAMNGHAACLEFALSHGCPTNKGFTKENIMRKKKMNKDLIEECLAVARKYGFAM